MDKKIAHTKAGSNRQINFKDNSASNQCNKLLDYLKKHDCITTSEARELLDIYYPPARIFELKAEGYLINTVWVTWTSEYQIKHRIAKYVLVQQQPLEGVKESEVA